MILVTFVATHKVSHGSSDSASSGPAQVQATKPKPAEAKHAAAAKHAAKPVKHAAAAPAKPVKHAAKHTTSTKRAPVKVKVPAASQPGAAVGLPASVAQALAGHKTVVLFFGGGGGADDARTADSVKALKAAAGRGVAVFMDKLSNLASYRRVVEGLDVSQAPSIVVVDPAHKAQLFEGFIDAGSLRQAVADVAR